MPCFAVVAAGHFRIMIRGKSAHVSTPQLGADALYIASHAVVAPQSLVTRLTSPVEPVIIGVGKLTAETTYNAPAETAGLEGTTRSVSQESQERIRDLGSRTVSSISDLYGGTAEIQLHTPGAYAYWGTGNTAHPHTLLPNHNGSFDVDAEIYSGKDAGRTGRKGSTGTNPGQIRCGHLRRGNFRIFRTDVV